MSKNRKMSLTFIDDFPLLKINKYTIKEVKEYGRKFNIIIKSKKKKDIIEECYEKIKKYKYIVKIQRLYKRFFINNFNKTLGPAKFNRSICNNEDDFLTTEKMNEIDYYFFISYKDEDNFIYGFNILSVFILITKKDYRNPYTRKEFSKKFIHDVKKRNRYNRILKKTEHEITNEINTPVNVNSKIIHLFQKMDELGNYTQVEWFTSLSSFKIKKFIMELYDIWFYRAEITNETKIKLCPPNGNPFVNINVNHIQSFYYPNESLKNIACIIMYNMLYSSNEKENQYLCSMYILSSLTLVSEQAAQTMPWLYQSVNGNN